NDNNASDVADITMEVNQLAAGHSVDEVRADFFATEDFSPFDHSGSAPGIRQSEIAFVVKLIETLRNRTSFGVNYDFDLVNAHILDGVSRHDLALMMLLTNNNQDPNSDQ